MFIFFLILNIFDKFYGKKKLKVNVYFCVEIGGKYSGDFYYGIDRYEEVKFEDMFKSKI